MKTILTLVLLLALSSACTAQQKQNSTVEYDQELAKKLGADDYGMKSYLLVILKTGPKDKEVTDQKQRAELFKGHFANMTKMQEEGKLKLAGPFSTKNHLGYRGIFLLDTTSEEEAKTLLQQDPTIAGGIFEVEILPWYGSAAIETHLDIHSKIAKMNP